jgi:hypothetical protein
MARTASVKRIPSLCLMVILLLPSLNVSASQAWSEGGLGFIGGELENLRLKAHELQLGYDSTPEGCWTLMSEGDPVGFGHRMVYDGRSGLIVMFLGYPNLTYTYNVTSRTWTQVDASPAPLRREYMAMAYDSREDRIVIFGGTIGDYIYINDTWSYDPENGTWKNVTPAFSPPAREYGAMVYDEGAGLMILFGGHGTVSGHGISFNDTWAYNVSANTWTDLEPAKSPVGRYHHASVYDSTSRKVILFGGGESSSFNDTWTYDYSTNTWTDQSPSNFPDGRQSHSMAYDTGLGATLLYGGNLCSGLTQKELWAYNISRNTWTMIQSPASPPGMYDHVMAYDTRNKVTVLLGGMNETGSGGMGTWLYDSAQDRWTNLTSPGRIQDQAMYYDPVKQRTMLFGGNHYATTMYGNPDLCSYDLLDNRWSLERTAPAPLARTGPSMAYDEKNGVAVLFGGGDDNERMSNETWTYNSTTARWTNVTPAESPPPSEYAAMAYDPGRERMVLFGAAWSNLTWIYDTANNTWKEAKTATRPPPFYLPKMVFDEAGVIVLFGNLNETWTYDPEQNSWTNMSPPVSPTLGWSCADYDRRLGVTVCFSGWNYTSETNETWVYDLGRNRWTCLDLGRSPLARGHAAMAYDIGADAFVLYSGHARDSEYGTDTWTFRLDGDPALAGNYTSRPFDIGGRARFGTMRANATTPAMTGLEIRLRTADTRQNLTARPFVGPDGTCNTFYKAGSENVFSGHHGDRWVQYRACFSATSRPDTPVLDNVTITYNLIQNLTLGYPNGGENITGSVNVDWAADDPDGNILQFDILLLNGGTKTTLISDLPAATRRWEWNTTDVPNGTYRVAVVARDGDPEIPVTVNATSSDLTVFHPPPANHPPEVTLLEPLDRSVVRMANATLKWAGSDYEGSPLTCRVHLSDFAFSTVRPPPPIATTQEFEYGCSGLLNGTTYFWTVIASDGDDNGTAPALRQFTVDLTPDGLPPAVELLRPENGSIVNATEIELAWNGSDPDGDELTYYLFLSNAPFDRSSLPTALTTTSSTRFQVPDLMNGTTYFWAVIGNDGTLNTTMAGPWNFKVVIDTPEPPKNSHPRITSGSDVRVIIGETSMFQVIAQDDDGDSLIYTIVSNLSWVVLDSATGEMHLSPKNISPGNYTMTIRVEDGRGGRAEQSFVVEAVVPELPVVQAPSCTITGPKNGSIVAKCVTITGTAAAFGGRTISSVQLRIGSGDWQNAAGTGNWSRSFDSTKLKNGEYVVQARAWDGYNFSQPAMITIKVKNTQAAGKSFLPGMEPILLAAAGALVLMLFRKRRGYHLPGG